MQYRQYGRTGIEVSRLAFGGMRFARPQDVEGMAEVVLAAWEAGINYFDTAPGYCADMSEKIIGRAIRQMKRGEREFYVSTKTGKSDPELVRADLHTSLDRLGLDRIDFYHCWYILTLDGWQMRKSAGAVAELLKAKEEGLVRHVVFSTHLDGDEVRRVIEENIFEGVTLGYNAINFPYRQEGIRAAGEAGIGVVVMNPLGGGTITENPETFSYIRTRPGQSMLESALEFLWSHEAITAALVGFRSLADVSSAVEVWKNCDGSAVPDLERMKGESDQAFDSLCTACRYCKDCPEGIEVYKFIEAYNTLMLKGGESLDERLRDYYGIDNLDALEVCTSCGQCEQACTQHLPILERFEEIKRVYGRGK